MSRKRFLFSGYNHKNEVSELKRQLRSVGGVCVDSESFTRDCTHLICNRISRTQKVLGALASGAWILTPDYVSACLKAGLLLSERRYEWSEEAGLKEERRRKSLCEESQLIPCYFYGAPKRCRETVATTKRGIFNNWVVAFFVSDAQKEAVYKAVLERGGATVLTVKLPSSRFNRNVAKLTHVIADESFTDKLVKFPAHGIPCISPDYIRNVLLRDLDCDVKYFSIYCYTSEQDPIFRDQKKLFDNARFGPVDNRGRLKVSNSVLSVSSQPAEKRERFKGSGSVVSYSSQPPATTAKRGRLKDVAAVVPFSSPPKKKMKKISAIQKCTSGPMDRFVTLTPSPQSSNIQSVASSPLSKPVKIEALKLVGKEGTAAFPIMISDSDEEFVSTTTEKKAVAKRLFTEATEKSVYVNKESRVAPIGIDRSPLKALTVEEVSVVVDSSYRSPFEKLKVKHIVIKKTPPVNGSTEKVPIVIGSTPEPCLIESLKRTLEYIKRTSALNGDGNTEETSVVVDSTPERKPKPGKKKTSSICDRKSGGVPLGIDSQTRETCSVRAVNAKLKAIRMVRLFGDEGSKEMPVVVDNTPKQRPMTRSKASVTQECKQESPLVISIDSGDEFEASEQRSATVRCSLKAKVLVIEDEDPIMIESDDGDTEDCSTVKQGGTAIPQSLSSPIDGLVRVNNEVLETTSVKGERMVMKDISASVLNAFTSLHKNDERALDRMSLSSFSYIESYDASIGCQATETSTEAPALFTSLLDACIDTQYYEMQTIDYIQSLLSNTYYPEPHIVSHVLWSFCLNGGLCISANAFRLLDLILTIHPLNSAKMQLYYQRVLCNCKTSHNPNSSLGWDRIVELLEFLYDDHDAAKLSKRKNTISPELFRRNCEKTLKFLVRLFEMDLCSTLRKGKDASTLPLIARLIWPNSSPDHVNASVRRLIECCLELAFTNVGHHRFTIVDHSTRLLATVAECCVLADSKAVARSFVLRPIIGNALTTFARSIVQLASERSLKSEYLYSFLKCLHPLSLRLKVSQFFLDSWTCTSTSNNQQLTMDDISSLYFPMVNGKTKPTKPKEDLKIRTTHRIHALRNIPLSPHKGKAEHVNKRNAKGETQLHRACIRNHLEKVRALLAVPGIDVLAPDNYGWTPLHEACNYGFIDCVRELLAYHPKKPIQKYFKPDSQKEYKLNVLVANAEGVTPLHDAVVNGHVEIARLLLQYGGKALLKARMNDGQTPLDCAASEEMVKVLTGFVNKRPYSETLSQEESFRPDTTIAAVGNKLMMVALYHLVESYVTIHKFRELSELVWCSNGIFTSSPMKPNVSVDCVRFLVDDVNKWLTLRHTLTKLPSTFGSEADDFDVGFLVRGFETLCSTKERSVLPID